MVFIHPTSGGEDDAALQNFGASVAMVTPFSLSLSPSCHVSPPRTDVIKHQRQIIEPELCLCVCVCGGSDVSVMVDSHLH